MSNGKVYNGEKEINIDAKTLEGRRNLLLHEIGHCLVAKHLEYIPVKLIFDVKKEIFYVNTPTNPINRMVSVDKSTRNRNLEELIQISLGGKVAEDLCGFQTAGFLASDLKLIYEFLEQLYQIKEISFPFKNVGDLLRNYESYLGIYENNTIQILEKEGGRKALEDITQHILTTYIEPQINLSENNEIVLVLK